MGNEQADRERMMALHRLALAPAVRRCLAGADPDLQEFAASLPAAVESVEGHLRRFWAKKGYSAAQVRDFAVRYGRALAACPAFQALEAAMAELGRLAGQPAFAERFASLARELGVDPDRIP